MFLVPRRTSRRRAFTLVEMLVVIAIIGILVSLAGVAVFRLIGTQQTSNTRSELTRLETEFQKQYRAAADNYRKEPIPTPGSAMGNVYYNTVLPMAGNDRLRAQVIWTKLRLKQTFPNNFNEALNPAPMPSLPYYQNTLSLLGYTAANTTSPQPWESSACLLLALERSTDGNGVSPETLGVNSFISNFATPSGQTIQGLVDGWHTPLAFCRWPVNSVVLNPSGPQPGDKNDPDDPSGLLVSTSWQNTPYPNMPSITDLAAFMQFCHPVPQHTAGQEATTFRIYPLIVSAGPDNKLGLDKDVNALTYTFATLPAPQGAGSRRQPVPDPGTAIPVRRVHMREICRSPRRRNAFTLIELLVVMALILVILLWGPAMSSSARTTSIPWHRPGRDRRDAQRQESRPPRRRADRHSHPVRHEQRRTQASQLQLIPHPRITTPGPAKTTRRPPRITTRTRSSLPGSICSAAPPTWARSMKRRCRRRLFLHRRADRN